MEKRRHERAPIDIGLTLREIHSAYELRSFSGDKIQAKALDLSATGIGFTADVTLFIGTTYSARIMFRDFNPFIIQLKVVNCTDLDHGIKKYGCCFEGHMGPLDQTPFFQELYHSLYE